MNCPHCHKPLTEQQIRSLWGQLKRSMASPVDPAKAKARAQKAAAARWGKKKPKEKRRKAGND